MTAPGTPPAGRFAGRVILITGAAGGIGAVLVRRFLREGGTVVAADRDSNGLARLVAAMAVGDALDALVADVTSEGDCAALADHLRARHGRLHVLVNNAGRFPARAFEDLTYAEWREILGLNLDSVFLVTKAVLPLMKAGGWGRIVNIGSTSVYRAPPALTPYVTAKAGVVGLTRCLANELGRHGITANVVAPGLTDTPGARAAYSAEEVAARAATRAIARTQAPDDLDGTVAFLASDDAAFITGQVVNVDGGAAMR